MASKATFLSLLAALLPLQASAAFLANWEGSHIDVAPDNRAIDWWYTQIVGQTPAANGIPPSVEVVLKHGNTFQFGTSNSPLYSVDVNGFDTDGTAFAQSFTFNTSTVAPTGKGLETVGSWGADEVTFCASSDLKTFTIHLNTSSVTGTIVINSDGHFRTGCGDTDPSASPFFDGLVSDGRPLTDAEVILYQKTGWRITAPGGKSTVDLTIAGKAVKFTGRGYKDSNWGPNAMNDFIRSWYVLIAEVGPYSFVTFSGQAKTGGNKINSGHLSINGNFVTSQCNIIGERSTDISIITPSGEVADNGVTAPTGFNLTFVLPSGKPISFQVTNVANSENPGVSIYHRWVGKYTGGAAGEHYQGYGITEWMNPANVSHWELIQ